MLKPLLRCFEPPPLTWSNAKNSERASPQQAQEVHAAIRRRLASLDAELAAGLRILYGGSVKPQNAAELFGQADVDGGLIGGAALVAEEFLAICRAAN